MECNDIETWRGVICRKCSPNSLQVMPCLLDFCANHSLFVTNTMSRKFHLQQNIYCISREVGDIDSEWAMLHTSIADVAV